MFRKAVQQTKRGYRSFTGEYQREAVALLLDGHSAASVTVRWGWRIPISCIAGGIHSESSRSRSGVDILNTHKPEPFYEAFPPAETRRLHAAAGITSAETHLRPA